MREPRRILQPGHGAGALAATLSGYSAAFKVCALSWAARQPLLVIVATWIIAISARLTARIFDLIDPLLRRLYPQQKLAACVTPDGGLEFFSVLNQTVTRIESLEVLSQLDTAWSAIELHLRPDQVLQRDLSLPAASRAFLDPVIEHRLERLVPWRPENVLYGYRAAPAEGPGGMMTVHFAATSSAIVAAPLVALRAAGLTATALGIAAGGPGKPLAIDFYVRSQEMRQRPLQRKFARLWLASFGVICLVFLLSAFWHAGTQMGRDSSELHLLKARKQLRLAAGGAIGSKERELIGSKRPGRSVVLLIDKLAHVIPQNTYLRELTILPDKVRLSGVSSNATALIGILDSAGLRDARFTAPVTRERDRTDLFEITAIRDRMSSQGAP